jgi:hypothetical protein
MWRQEASGKSNHQLAEVSGMKRWLLAATILLSGSIASAWGGDYIIIVVDPTKKQETPPQTGPNGQPNPRGEVQPPTTRPNGGNPMGGIGTGTPAPSSTATAPATEPEGIKVLDFNAISDSIGAVVRVAPVDDRNYKAFYGMPQQAGYPSPPPQTISVTGTWGSKPMTIFHTLGEKNEIDVFIAQNKHPAKPDSLTGLALADWYLRHDDMREFYETMAEFTSKEGQHPATKAYMQVKDNLGKHPKTPESSALRSGLLADWHPAMIGDSPHFIAYFSPTQRVELPPEVKSRLLLLEQNLHRYYYWFALRGIALPAPTERLPVIVPFQADEFKMLNEQLAAAPVSGNGFVGRREGVLVLASQRRDPQFLLFEKYASKYWTDGLNYNAVLANPKEAVKNQSQKYGSAVALASLQAMALAQHALEAEGELKTVTNDGSRQLLYPSGLLNRNVIAPEWIQFGMGSFFETPHGSPYFLTASANCEYLPMFRDLKTAKMLGKSKEHTDYDPVDTLRKIVTDQYFRQAQRDRLTQKSGGLGSMRRARATAWALVYFLAQGNNKLDGDKHYLEGLQRYFQELAKLPRDMELDDTVLLACFGKAFGLMSGEQIDEEKFARLAREWDTFLNQEHLELPEVMDKIRDKTNKFMYINADGELIVQPDNSTHPGQYGPGGNQNGPGGTKPNGGGPPGPRTGPSRP